MILTCVRFKASVKYKRLSQNVLWASYKLFFNLESSVSLFVLFKLLSISNTEPRPFLHRIFEISLIETVFCEKFDYF